MTEINELIIEIEHDQLDFFKSDLRKQKYCEINWYENGKLPSNIIGTRMFYLLKNTNEIKGFTLIRGVKELEEDKITKIMFSYFFEYFGPQNKRILRIPANGFKIYEEEFGASYNQLKQKQPYDLEILRRCIDGVQNSYENAYSLHSHLPRYLQEKYSHDDILILFNRLHWNCQILSLDVKKISIGSSWSRDVEKRNIEIYSLNEKLRMNYLLQYNEEFLYGILEIVNNNWKYEKMKELLIRIDVN